MTRPESQPPAHAAGERSIAVGRDATGVFATGDHNQFFIGGYERLSDAYLNPSSLVRNLDLDHFTGRQDVLRTIADFIASNVRGYVEIEGGLGVGKTTLLAWLATRHGYLHHFVQLMPNRGDLGTALRNLCAQLIRAWDLHSWAVGGILPQSASRPDVFYEVLQAACDQRALLRPGEPIVLVIDGLDEAGRLQSGNPLALPRRLPDGVFVIVAHRDVYVPLVVDPPKIVLELTAAQSRPDVVTYLADAARRPEVAARLARAGVSPEAFVDTVVERTGGLWLYVSYVIVEVESGSRSPADLARLPGGLWQYYEQFWRSWQDDDPAQWREVYLPLLSTLGAAREKLSAAFLARLAGIDDPDVVETLLSESWAPFLDIDDTDEPRGASGGDGGGGRDGGARYGISQASVRAFLEGRVDAASLNQAEVRTARRTAEATRRAHDRIAERYLVAWGGLAAGLPELKSSSAAAMDGAYGLRHLVEHLIAAERYAELHDLLWMGWEATEAPADAPPGRVVNAWRQTQENAGLLAVYLNDVASAWRLVEEQSAERVAAGEATPSVSMEFRYALLSASVSSMAANVPPALLRALLESGRLSALEVIAYARRGPDPLSRIEALLSISAAVPSSLRQDVLREALVAVQSVEDEQFRTGALARLAPSLPVEWRAEASTVAATVTDPLWRRAAHDVVERMVGVGAIADADVPSADPGDQSWHDPELALAHAVWFARTLQERQSEALSRLASRLPRQSEGDVLADVLASARLIPPDRWRAEALTAIATALPATAPSRGELLEEALASARAVGDSAQHAAALAALALRLAAAGMPDEALATARSIRDPYRRTATIADLIDRVSGTVREDAVVQASRAVAEIQDEAQRARVLSRHPALLLALADADGIAAEARRAVHDDYWRAVLFAALADVVDEPLAADIGNEAFSAALGLHFTQERAEVLVRLAPHLDADSVDVALPLVCAESSPEDAMAVGALAVRCVALGQPARAVSAVRGIADPHGQAEALTRLASALAATDYLDDAVAVARDVPYPHWRAGALARLSSRLTGPDSDALLDEAVRVATSTPPADSVEALLLVAEHGPSDSTVAIIGRAASVARTLSDSHDRTRSLVRVAVALATAGQTAAALGVAAEIVDEHWRAATLRDVAGHVRDRQAAQQTLAMARALVDEAERARVLGGLLPAFTEAPLGQLYDVWQDEIRSLGMGTRRDLLVALPELLPAIGRLGGPHALVDARDIVESVRRWWP